MRAAVLIVSVLAACGDDLDLPADATPEDQPRMQRYELGEIRCMNEDRSDLEEIVDIPRATLATRHVSGIKILYTFRFERPGCAVTESWTELFADHLMRDREILSCEPPGCQLDAETPPCTTGEHPAQAPVEGSIVLDVGDLYLELGRGYPGLCSRRNRPLEEQLWLYL